jgi:SpoVK/Ycf46/Vps4 family AAA+-type ATPase
MQDSKKIASGQEIKDLIRARYRLIYVVSSEEARVEKAIMEIAQDRKRNLIAWTCTEGFKDLYRADAANKAEEEPARPGARKPQSEAKAALPPDTTDPIKALDQIAKYEEHAIFLFKDYHPFLESRNFPVIRKLRDINEQFREGKYYRNIVFLAPVLKVPAELENTMAVVDYELPTRNDIEGILNKSLRSLPPEMKLRVREDDDYKYRIVEAALGLTAEEAENVYSKSLVRTRDFDIDTILSEKKHIIRKSGILEFYESQEGFKDIGGLEVLKAWLLKRQAAFTPNARKFGLPLPKGILMIGVPGCGKSLTAKAIGSLWQMPLLRLDVGKVFSSLVGSSEENIRKAIRTAEAVAPSILWLDELEKGFSGTGSSGQSDGGTTARVFGSFLTWLQEKESPVFVIATANDVSQLPPELLRKGRFDEIFFVDLPTEEERAKIIEIHLRRKGRDPAKFNIEQFVRATQGFSGSEIEQALVSALFDAYFDYEDGRDVSDEMLLQATGEIIPLSYTAKEKIDFLREWARARARRASAVSSEQEGKQVRMLEI